MTLLSPSPPRHRKSLPHHPIQSHRRRRLRRESPSPASQRTQKPGAPQAKQRPQSPGPLPRPLPEHPRVPPRLRRPLRQQPSRTRPAHDEGPPENLRHLPQLRCPRELLPHPRTARKNSLDALDALRRIFLGNPFLPTPARLLKPPPPPPAQKSQSYHPLAPT